MPKQLIDPILEENVKSTTVDVIFRREGLNPQTLKTTYGFFACTVTFKIDPNHRYKNWSLTKIIGSTLGRRENGQEVGRTVKVFLFDGSTTFELDFKREQQAGIDVVISSPKRITKEKALELISSGQCKYFDNEDLTQGNLLN